jgi:hypothetical protein
MIKMELKQIAEELRTQDNLSTEHPIFILFEIKKLPTDPDYSDKYFYLDSPNDCAEFETLDELINYCKEYDMVDLPSDFDSFSNGRKEDLILEHSDIRKIYYLEVNEFRQAFFTMKSAKEYLEANKHHFKKPLIYCDSLWRNYEMQIVRDALINNQFQEKIPCDSKLKQKDTNKKD